MRALVRNLYFWIATLILLAVVGTILLWFVPPLINQIKTNRAELAKLNTEVSDNEQFLATIQIIEEQTTILDSLNEKALLSLPKDTQPEILILQLEGLLESLNLSLVKIEAPLGTQVTSAEGQGTQKFTLTGTMTFDQTKQLITRLRGLSRWNKLISIDITQQQDRTSVTIAGEAFSKPGTPKSFTGSKTFLTDAKALFDSLTPYTTIPDVQTEGNFGKNDPFN